MIGDFKVITTRIGITLIARLVRAGELYGNRHARIHSGLGPMVEIYDTREYHTDVGKLIGRYLVTEIMTRDQLFCKDCKDMAMVDSSALLELRSWLRRQTGD